MPLDQTAAPTQRLCDHNLEEESREITIATSLSNHTRNELSSNSSRHQMTGSSDTALSVPGRRRKKLKACATISVLLVVLLCGTIMKARNGIAQLQNIVKSSASTSGEQGRRNLTAFEQHYLKVYKSMMIEKEVPPKFVLWKLEPHAYGFGNKVRSLNGAMFAAAITNRVLLVDCLPFTSLFEPPILDGTVLDWDVDLATANGMCTNAGNATSDANSSTVLLYQNAANANFAKYYVNFDAQYGNASCLVASASHGHDRQIASFNEGTYKEKVKRLFGHPTSRYNWSRHTLGLVMQRLKPQVKLVLKDTLKRTEIANVPPERRLGIHIRTFFDEASNGWTAAIMAKKRNMMDCINSLLSKKIDKITGREAAVNTAISILFVSDNVELKTFAQANLTRNFPSIRFVDPGLNIVHTGSQANSTGSKFHSTRGDFDAYLDWLLLGECSTVIATGFSSFGLTSYFRPGTYPYQPTYHESNASSVAKSALQTKDLFTIDRLVPSRPRFMNMGNKMCGRIQPEGYEDLNYGIMDALYKRSAIDYALSQLGGGNLKKEMSISSEGGTIKGQLNLLTLAG